MADEGGEQLPAAKLPRAAADADKAGAAAAAAAAAAGGDGEGADVARAGEQAPAQVEGALQSGGAAVEGAAGAAGGATGGAAGGAEAADGETDAPAKAPKRKVAVFIAYVGLGYAGMQRNPGQKTIESELERAFHEAGVISDSNFGDPAKVQWSRAARTDKGVSAVGQVVALRMQMEAGATMDALRERINAKLPDTVRVLGIRRVTNGFNAKQQCDRRLYEYVLPVFAFNPHACAKLSREERVAAFEARKSALGEEQARQQEGDEFDGKTEEERYAAKLEELRKEESAGGWEWTEDVRQRVKDTLSQYLGTHNFHNFAARVKYTDSNAKRYMVRFDVSEPFEVCGVRLVRCTVLGQSFMLNQIRKMIGAMLATVRGSACENYMKEALSSPVPINTPLAPELGLFLHECVFKAYNDKWGQGHHDSGELSMTDYRDQTDAFKLKHMYPHMARTEVLEGTVALFLKGLNTTSFPYFLEPDKRPEHIRNIKVEDYLPKVRRARGRARVHPCSPASAQDEEALR